MSKLAIAAIILGVAVYLLRPPKADISGPEARKLVEAGALLVDVRSQGEFADGHVDGAINLPVGEIGGRLEELGDKDRDVVVYCRGGRRSARAKSILVEHGFVAVRNLGGMGNW